MNQTHKKHIVVFLVLVAVGFGISYLHYKDMVTPIPEFESLKQIPADGIRYELARPRGGSGNLSFEFFNQNGNRYQTDYMKPEEARAIEDALQRGGVIIFVGRWKSPIESNSIFSIYHMTRGDQVLIDYKNMAESKKKEQQNAVPMAVSAFILVVGVIVFALWISHRGKPRFPPDAKARG